MAQGPEKPHVIQTMAVNTRPTTSQAIQIWLLRLLVFLPGVRQAFIALIERYFAARVQPAKVAPVQTPPPLLLPPIFKPVAATISSACDDFVSVPSISSRSASDVSSSSSSLYYDLSDTDSTDSSVSDQLRTLFAMASIPNRRDKVNANNIFPLDNSIFLAQEHRIITPRPTPPSSPAVELDLSFPSTPSSESRASYSRRIDSSAFRERVHSRLAARLAANRKDLEEDPNYTGPRMLYNGRDMYAVAGTLGAGAHGRVMYAKNTDAHDVAIKIIHKAKAYRTSCGRDTVLNELKALKRVTENDIAFACPLLSSWSDEKNIYLVMPCLRENLLQRMDRRRLSEKDVLLFSAELISAVASLHSCGVIHRDIKPENVLFDAHGHIVLADFGLAYTTSCSELSVKYVSMRDVVGTPGYWAPEVVCVTTQDGYGWEIDIWSTGLVIFDMALNRTTPFYDAHKTDEARRQMMLYEIPIWNIRDDLLKDLLSQMLVRNPNCRWSAQNLRDHEYFEPLDWEGVETKDYQVNIPPHPQVDDSKRSLRFSTFHRGMDEGCPSVTFNSKREVVPNRNAWQQLVDDQQEPGAFDFTMNAEYRRNLVREFVREHDIPFHSRYNPNPRPIPPPPGGFIRPGIHD